MSRQDQHSTALDCMDIYPLDVKLCKIPLGVDKIALDSALINLIQLSLVIV